MNAPEKINVQATDLDSQDLQLLAQIAATRYGVGVERVLAMNLSDPRASYASEAMTDLFDKSPYYDTVILARDSKAASVDAIETLSAFAESGASRVVVIEPTEASFMSLNDALVEGEQMTGFGNFERRATVRQPGKK